MIIEVKELCLSEGKQGIRTVEYEANKETLLEAFQEYMNVDDEFNIDNVLNCCDTFEGGCDDIVKILSVKEIKE